MSAVRTIQARATVILTVEVRIGCSWGEECTVRQVHDQASSAAVGAIRRLIELATTNPKISLVGDPQPTAILVDRIDQ